MNELLFEAYNVPSVNYGLDALYAAYANDIREDGLVISSGKNTTVVVPLVGGRGILDNSKRFVYVFCIWHSLSWGGALANDYLMRLLQLKYPTLPQRLTAFEVQAMLEDLCYVSSDYSTELSSFHDPEVLASVDRCSVTFCSAWA